MHTIIRKMTFDAGHRVYGHESKCAHVHGHTYHLEIECTAHLDALGRVIDFSVIKEVCCKWVDDNLDHGMILFADDPMSTNWFHKHKLYVMDKNPTAENIAEMLYKQFDLMLAMYGVKMVSVTVHETPNCRATYRE